VEFKGNNVYLTPYELGKTSIMFKGDDMQGGVISVNATLVVKEPEVPYAESYFDYILIGVVLLIIVLGVLRLTEDKNNNNSKKKK
ncbi:hypothetical protein HQ529_02715, partial [Candidatus Woesearchaeota archaeon]|nr:hypothetical protein [Candidatus Woesearchaeota archaeon]